jgi:hypothetical protein
MRVQDAADAALGPEGGAAFWKGTDREAFNRSEGLPPEAATHDYEQALRKVQNAGTKTLGDAGSSFNNGVLQGKYAANPIGDRAYIAQSTGPIGTIGTMGQGPAGAGSGFPLGDVGNLSDDLAAATPADIDMPDDFVGKVDTEMPDDFVGKVTLGQPRPIADSDDFGNGPTQTINIPSPPFSSPAGLDPIDPYGPGYVSAQPSGLLTPPLLGQAADAIGRAANAVAGAPAKAAEAADSRKPLPMPDDYLDGDELGVRMAGKSPEEQALFRDKIERAKQDHAAIRQMEELEKNRRAMEDNLKARNEAARVAQYKRVQNDMEAKTIADQNPMDSIPAYRKVAGVISAFLTGLTGSKAGIEVVQSIANEAAQQQQQRLAVLAQKRRGIGEEMEGAEDTYRAAEGARLATYDMAIKGLEAELQKYDPRGSTAVKVMDDIAQIRAGREARQEKQLRQDFEDDLKIAEYDLKKRAQDREDAKLLREEQRKAAANLGAKKPDSMSSSGYFDPTSSKWIPFPDGIKLGIPERKNIRDVGVHYVKYRAGLQQLKALVDEVKQETVKGRVSDGWKSAKEREYNSIATMMAYQQAKMADPTSVVRAEELTAFRKVLPAPSSIFGSEYEAADDVYKALTDAADSNYAAEIRGYGLDPNEVIGSVHGKEREPQGPANSLEIEKSVAPDYVPGHVFDIGPSSDVVKGFDSYVRNFADKRIDGTEEQLRAELGSMVDKNRASLRKAEADLAKAQQGKDKAAAEKAQAVKQRWQTIVTDMEAKLKTLDLDAERKKSAAQKASSSKADAFKARYERRGAKAPVL